MATRLAIVKADLRAAYANEQRLSLALYDIIFDKNIIATERYTYDGYRVTLRLLARAEPLLVRSWQSRAPNGTYNPGGVEVVTLDAHVAKVQAWVRDAERAREQAALQVLQHTLRFHNVPGVPNASGD